MNRKKMISIQRGELLESRILETLIENGGSIAGVCELCGITRVFLATWRAESKEFDARVRHAIHASTEVQEDKLVDLCAKGMELPMLHHGKVVAVKRVYQASFFRLLLEARKPEVYARRPDVQHHPRDGNRPSRTTVSPASTNGRWRSGSSLCQMPVGTSVSRSAPTVSTSPSGQPT